MQSLFPRLTFVLLLLLGSVHLSPAAAADAEATTDTRVSAAEARRTLEVLQDPKRRAQLEETLGAIAAATAQAEPEPAAVETPVEEKPIALTRDGVVAQVFARVDRWFDAIGAELQTTAQTFLQFRSVGTWWEQRFGDADVRAQTLRSLGTVIAILLIALAVEWVIKRLVRRPRELVAQHAAKRYAAEEAKRAAARASVGASPLTTSAPVVDANDGGAEEVTAPPAPGHKRLRYDRHWGVLRRIPYSIAFALLKWVPLLGFLSASSLLVKLWGGPAGSFYGAVLPLIGAYAACRVTMSAVGVVVTPAGPGLRLAPISNDRALFVRNWIRRIVVVAVFGSALAEVALSQGATVDGQNAISKLVSLVVHGMLIVMVVQCRATVAAFIRGHGGKSESLNSLRALLADIWAPLTVLFIIAMWVVWALGVTNGFQQLLRYFAMTTAVILAAVVIAILALGALDKAFFTDHTDSQGHVSAVPQAVRHYQLLTQRAVSTVVAIVAFLALLEVWGLEAFSWFGEGTIGRSIASAAATIGIACILAIVAWETINLSINRRVERWTQGGDLVRATRLRTLVPILRSTLFVIIAMVVVLTALNQLGINIAPLLAGASILGVALGFGSQKLVQDFITGIFLLMENAMQVGDSVTVAGVSGVVEYLSIRTVRLRAGDGSLHVIPFSSVSTVTNTNRGIGNAAIRLSVRGDSDLDLVISTIKQVGAEMREDPRYKDVILADLDLWGVDQIDGATVTLAGQIRTTDRGRWSVQRGFNQLIWRRFRELGIKLTNPQETVFTGDPASANHGAAPLLTGPEGAAPTRT